jgi:hypothetical protein
MATTSGAVCDAKLRLSLEWNKAAQEYSDAVTNLSVKIGISVQPEYQRLQHLVEEPRIALEQARPELDKHVSDHHC